HHHQPLLWNHAALGAAPASSRRRGRKSDSGVQTLPRPAGRGVLVLRAGGTVVRRALYTLAIARGVAAGCGDRGCRSRDVESDPVIPEFQLLVLTSQAGRLRSSGTTLQIHQSHWLKCTRAKKAAW